MELLQAYFKDFRNIEAGKIIFSPGVNVLYGNNAEGKTNAVEAIYFFAQGRSFRTVHEKEFLRFGAEMAEIGITFRDKNRESSFLTRFAGGKRVCMKNGAPISRMSELLGGFRAVLFTPSHLSIVQDGPAVRRNFLDLALSQLKPRYIASLRWYYSVLEQRNTMLKNDVPLDFSHGVMMEVYNDQLATAAEEVASQRIRYTEKLSQCVSAYLSDMTGGRERVTISYRGGGTKEDYRKRFTESLDRECRMGVTLSGVHKEDLEIRLNDCDVRSFASQGQQRSIALAMKLAEGELSKALTGEYPVFLLDDVFSELDENRKEYLLRGMEGRQVILTACDIAACKNVNANVYEVRGGSYEKRK